MVILSVSLIITEHRGNSLNSLRSILSILVYPVQFLVSLPSTIAHHTIATGDLREKYNKLKQQQLVTQGKLLKFEALEKENIRLRALLANSFKLGEQVLVAEILSVNLAPYEHTVLVNKGTRFGVHAKQPVMDAYGIVGQVIRSTPLTSEIILITDPSHATPVQVNRNGLRTIAIGSGLLNRLILPYLPTNADIRPGDLLVTSGLGGLFPYGYPVAVVDNFESQPDKPFANIFATPKAHLDKSRELLIVWSDSKPKPLTENPTSEKQQNDVTE